MSVTTGTVGESLARMEGKLDQVITDHDRRLGEQSQTINAVVQTVSNMSQITATNTANITSVIADVSQLRADTAADITELKTHSSGALGKVMSVISPIIALGSLSLAFIIYTVGG